jgi:hypothetical protein
LPAARRRLAALDWLGGRWERVLVQWRTLPQVLKWGEIQVTVPHLEQLARAYAVLGLDSDAARTVQQFAEAIDRSPYLDWGCTMPILFACGWYAARPKSLVACRSCLRQLERADGQFRTPETRAALDEGMGIVAGAEERLRDAAGHFQSAAEKWEAMGRPYDQTRALSGLGRALAGAEQTAAAHKAFEDSVRLLDSLAAQLTDPQLRQSYLNSPLVRAARQACIQVT